MDTVDSDIELGSCTFCGKWNGACFGLNLIKRGHLNSDYTFIFDL